MMRSLTHVFGPGVEGLSTKDAARSSAKCFVRSEGQIAVCDFSKNPTGHVLTSWEALTAYGIEVLEEAVEYGSAILKRTQNSTASALKRRREALGLTHDLIGKSAKVSEGEVKSAESTPSSVSLVSLERVAFTLGLDERFLAFTEDSGADDRLAYRLRTLATENSVPMPAISKRTSLLFAEAASIIRAQHRLHEWLALPKKSENFDSYDDYGSVMTPAWKIGYRLAGHAREILQLGQSPIHSMRELTETELGIPVIQATLPQAIAGATIMTKDKDSHEVRGIVLNTVGENENVWIRRATLAHELGHLLYDPDASLQNVRVDSYSDSQRNPETDDTEIDFVEQRANAFAIAFLAPNSAVKTLTEPPVSEESVSRIMHTFGISHTAARHHIYNIHYRQYQIPPRVIHSTPSDEQTAVENFTADYFPLSDTPIQRRGKFAGLVLESYQSGVISEDTATLYLGCSKDDLRNNLTVLCEIFGVDSP